MTTSQVLPFSLCTRYLSISQEQVLELQPVCISGVNYTQNGFHTVWRPVYQGFSLSLPLTCKWTTFLAAPFPLFQLLPSICSSSCKIPVYWSAGSCLWPYHNCDPTLINYLFKAPSAGSARWESRQTCPGPILYTLKLHKGPGKFTFSLIANSKIKILSRIIHKLSMDL